jgi:phosphoribosylformylglycinamidine synthase
MVGAKVDLSVWDARPLRALLVGEAQARVVASTRDAKAVLAIAKRHGVPARVIGAVAATEPALSIQVGPRRIVAPLDRIARAWHDAIPTIMSRSVSTTAAVITETLATPVN